MITYRDTLAGLLGGELLAWCLTTSRLTSGLLQFPKKVSLRKHISGRWKFERKG